MKLVMKKLDSKNENKSMSPPESLHDLDNEN